MAGTFVVLGENVKVQFAYLAPIATVQDIVYKAVEYIWATGYRKPFEDQQITLAEMTPQQRLDILDAYILNKVVELAIVQHVINAETAVREAAQIEAENLYMT